MTEERLGPPPIEPLSDVAWARVERGLWARLDGSTTTRIAPERPSRRWVWIAAPLVAAAAIVLVVSMRGGSSEDGGLEVADRGSDARDVRVVSPATAPTSASFNDAYIELEPASAVVMRHDQPTTVLERGAATFAVAPRGTRAPFVVLAGETKVRVIGTKFRVARSDERVAVEVEHGIVEVQYKGSIVRVAANESWSSDRPVVSATEIDMEPTRVIRRQKAKPTAVPKTEKTEITTTQPDARLETGKPDPDRAKFEKLAALEKKSPAAAMTGYLELSQSSGRWAANALYAAARLAVDRGDPRAQTLLTVYLKRFPSGANADDARELLARFSQ
jgi:hypothetical protein